MKSTPTIALVRAISALLLLSISAADISSAAEVIYGERATYFALEKGSPAEIQVFESTEAEANGIVVKVFVHDADGLPVRVFESGLTPPRGEVEDRREFRGRGIFDSAPIFWAVELGEDGETLVWRAPVSVELRDGRSVELSSEEQTPYRETTKLERLERARAAFARQDAELNRLYGELKVRLAASDFEALRNDQRQWLVYRDRWTADDDNSAIEGPGSIHHTWRQAERTRDRIAYLRALEGAATNGESADAAAQTSGEYSNGRGSVVYFRPLRAEGPAWFSLSIDRAPHEPAASDPYVEVWGLAEAGSNETWQGQPALCGAYRTLIDSNQPPTNLVLKRDRNSGLVLAWSEGASAGRANGEGPSDEVPGSSGSGYQSRLVRVADLSAATEPMGRFLTTLPAAAFEDLVEPPDPEPRRELAETGQTRLNGEAADEGSRKQPEHWNRFRIDKTGPHYLRLAVPFGQWTLCRYPRPDGSALLVVQTGQDQNQTTRFWECDSSGKTFTEVGAESFLPELYPSDFYADDGAANAALERHGHPSDKAAWRISEPGTGSHGTPPWIELHYPAIPPAEGEAQPSRYAVLPWHDNGFGFELWGS